jgi:hypothetical protein
LAIETLVPDRGGQKCAAEPRVPIQFIVFDVDNTTTVKAFQVTLHRSIPESHERILKGILRIRFEGSAQRTGCGS